MSRVLVISDLQAPFQHPKSVPFLESLYEQYKCDRVVCIGDPCDNKFLKFLSINDPMSAREQHDMALQFFRRLYSAFPIVSVVDCNHTVERPIKQAESANIPMFMLKSPKEYMEAPPTWHWYESVSIDSVKYEHGHRFGGKTAHIKATQANRRSTVIGHHPILGVEYFEVEGVSTFSACFGALTVDANGDRMSWGMKYAKQYSSEMPRGAGVVLEGKIAIAVPLL